MLDSTTKRRIDTCRDILVGKVPDPKSQVEQITIALIYKFMDDMDAEAEELGGQRSFFAGEYGKYGWARLMAPNQGGFEVLALYSEAIGKMNENPGIPALFRDIFKNAYLPYRDPETLRAFLKEIDGFTYDHSERLGDAFEYLLSVLGSQGDAGQFRTPRHIIDFMVDVINPQKNESILDPACGTAGFLISAWKHILKQNTSGAGQGTRAGDQLSPTERANLVANIHGYDISPDMVRLSLVNLYLHGFTDPHIVEYDSLTSEERWNETADVILANPPFMSPKGGIKPHKRFSVQATRSEVLFVDYMAEHLSPQGRAAIVVPEGIIFQSGTAYKKLREMLVKTSLVAVVSLPAGVFNPYSGVKTSILILDKRLAKSCDSVLFVKVENDGFNLGAQRRAVTGDDLPEAGRLLRAFFSDGAAFENDPMAHKVTREKIGENGEWNLSGERYIEASFEHAKFPVRSIGDVCAINPKKSELSGYPADTVVSFVPMKDLAENSIGFQSQEQRTLADVLSGAYTYFRDGDVLIAKVTPCFENGKAGIARNLTNSIGFGSSEYYVLRPSEAILPELLYYFLSSPRFKEYATPAMTGTGGLQRVPRSTLELFKIPLPPLAIQREIVAEIDGYQKIIDGARQVVENYRPRILVQPAWPVVELGEKLSFVTSGATPKGGKETYLNEGVLFIRSQNILSGSYDFSDAAFISEPTHREMSRSQVKQGDVFLNITGASIGRSAWMDLDISANVNQHVAILRVGPELDGVFLSLFLNSDTGQQQIQSFQAGASREALNYSQIKQLKISLPPLETQRAIVAEIKAEQVLVNANKQLIARFEAKIKATINRVWGSSE